MGESVICDKGGGDMTNHTQQELDQLRDLAKPFRFRVVGVNFRLMEEQVCMEGPYAK